MIVGTDVEALVVGFLHSANGPGATDHGMGFEQFHRTIGVHLGRDNGAEIVLKVDGVDGCLGTVGIGTYLELAGKFLVFMAVPMKTNADADILENERVSALLKLDMRRG